MVWTLVEPGVAITAACLVTMRPLLRSLNFSGFESTPAAGQHTPLRLRNDISGGHWSTISSKGKDGHSHKRNFSATALEKLNESGSQISHLQGAGGDGESGVYEMDESGITKTVQVKVVHGHASQVGN